MDEGLNEGPFTPRQLLRHQADLPDCGELPAYHAAIERGDIPWSEEEMLKRLDARRLRYHQAADGHTSTPDFVTYGRLIERSAVEDIGSALRLALHPLGLHQVQLVQPKHDLDEVNMHKAMAYDPR
jgi:CubicO group peptidase (beta-lactamase class C family)